jgi:hypothetical protein
MEQRLFCKTVSLRLVDGSLGNGHTESKDDPLAGCSLRLLEVAENARTGNDDTARSGCTVRSIREVVIVCFAIEDMVAMVKCEEGNLGRE